MVVRRMTPGKRRVIAAWMVPVAFALVLWCAHAAVDYWAVSRIPGLSAHHLKTDEGAIAYFENGDPRGTRVIFIHGSPGKAATWASYLKHPMPSYDFIAVARPGYGASFFKTEKPALAQQARALHPLLATDSRKSILVGHSFGVLVACQLALDYPGDVAGLVLIAGPFDPANTKPSWWQGVLDSDPIRRIVPRILRHSNKESLLLETELNALSARLPEIACPVIIIHGTGDETIPVSDVAVAQTRLDRDIVEAIILPPNHGHDVHQSAEDEVRRAIALVADASS